MSSQDDGGIPGNFSSASLTNDSYTTDTDETVQNFEPKGTLNFDLTQNVCKFFI